MMRTTVDLDGYARQIERDGFARVSDVFSAERVTELRAHLDARARAETADVRRRRDVYAIRNLLRDSDYVRDVATGPELRTLAEPILGAGYFAVRCIYFDKPPEANWNVLWHQDQTIAVHDIAPEERAGLNAAGFQAWTKKSGVCHVEPPRDLLEQILTLRIRLDDCDAGNGALTVQPGSHRHGRLGPERVAELTTDGDGVLCSGAAGSVLAMRPLLLHSSRSSQTGHDRRRRVLHLEFAARELPEPLRWYFR